MTMMTTQNTLFLDAAWGKDTERAPVWMMRQAGRYLPEYMAIKEKSNFWEMCRTPELASEITLQPIRRLDVDAAILFQDIMTPLPPMGIDIEFSPGPVIQDPIRYPQAVDKLRIPEQDEIAPYVAEAIKLIRNDSPVPLLGLADLFHQRVPLVRSNCSLFSVLSGNVHALDHPCL